MRNFQIGDRVQILDIGNGDCFYQRKVEFIGMTGTIATLPLINRHEFSKDLYKCCINFDEPDSILHKGAKDEHDRNGSVYFVEIQIKLYDKIEVDYEKLNSLSRRIGE